MSDLNNTVKELLARGKGILAADESNRTAAKRLEGQGIKSTPENRRRWREVLLGTAGIEESISGVILYDETIKQNSEGGTPFAELLKDKGIIPGIKADKGAKPMANFPEEKLTEGLDGLRERLPKYAKMGAKFTKWRAVILIDEEKNLPSSACIDANSFVLAQYAALSQEAGLVPIVEPEVLLDGEHSMEKCEEVMILTLRRVFEALLKYKVKLPETILKSSMVLPGKDSKQKASPYEVAEATIHAFSESVPENTGGIVFLSGGQSPESATANLDAIAKNNMKKPWPITFSFSRALQDPVLQTWDGRDENMEKAREIFLDRVRENAAASSGEYRP